MKINVIIIIIFSAFWIALMCWVATFEMPNICERAEAARAELMACQALPNCKATLRDLHHAVDLHQRCEEYKK